MCRIIFKIILLSVEELLDVDGNDNEEMVICLSKELIGDRV